MTETHLDKLQRSLEVVTSWRPQKFRDALDRSTVELRGVVGDFPLADLETLADEGHHVELVISNEGFEAIVSLRRPGGVSVDAQSGPLEDGFSGSALADARSALEDGRTTDFLRAAVLLPCAVRVTLQVNPATSGFHWVRTAKPLMPEHIDGLWLDLIEKLVAHGGPTRTVIQDAGRDQIVATGLTLQGPDAPFTDPPGYDVSSWDAYRQEWLRDERSELPPAIAVWPEQQNGLASVRDLLARSAQGLSWLWIASSVTRNQQQLAVGFEATTYRELDMTSLPPADNARDALDLCRWAIASTDPARRDAVEQAVTIVISDAKKFSQSAAAVLRTAKLVLKLSQQGAIREALAARRGVLDAALSAARASAETARSAARSSSERAFAAVVAAVGLLLANRSSLLAANTARLLYVLSILVVLATGVAAFVVDFPVGTGVLRSFKKDLAQYDDVLTEDEIARIRELATLRSAAAAFTRARWVTIVVVAAAAAALGLGLWQVR